MSSCPVCGADTLKDYPGICGYKYTRCGTCSLVFMDGDCQTGKDVLYNKEYIKRRGHDKVDSYIAKAKAATATYYLKLVEKYASRANLLEVGCSTGIALKAARDRGWNIYGVEANEAAVQVARGFLKVDTIRSGYLTPDIFPDDFFSAIVMFDVIEHIKDPMEFMQILKKQLKPSGILLLVTPNIDSISARVLKDKWPHFFAEHVCLYSGKSLRFLLEKTGFSVKRAGWAIKFINTDILRRHIDSHPGIFLAKTLSAILRKTYLFDRIIFPFNIGEMYVIAQKQ